MRVQQCPETQQCWNRSLTNQTESHTPHSPVELLIILSPERPSGTPASA